MQRHQKSVTISLTRSMGSLSAWPPMGAGLISNCLDFYDERMDFRSLLCFGCVEPGADLPGMVLVVVVGIARDECKEGAAF